MIVPITPIIPSEASKFKCCSQFIIIAPILHTGCLSTDCNLYLLVTLTLGGPLQIPMRLATLRISLAWHVVLFHLTFNLQELVVIEVVVVLVVVVEVVIDVFPTTKKDIFLYVQPWQTRLKGFSP